MHISVVFLLFAACELCASIGVYNRGFKEKMQERTREQLSELLITGNKLQPNFQSGAFFEGIRDWLADLKDSIHGRLFGSTVTTTLPLLSSQVLNLNRTLLEKQVGNLGWLPLDLSTISLDPHQDWGFRKGNWYLIYRDFTNKYGFENSDESDVDFSRTTLRSLTKVHTEEIIHTTNDFSSAKGSSITPTAIALILNSVTQRTEFETTTESIAHIDSSKKSPMRNKLTDNESDRDLAREGSVEVLMG